MEKGTRIWVYVILIGVVLLIWGGFAIWVIGGWSDLPARSQYGDSFGVINTLFSGLAFAGLIITILMQQEELSLQREELKMTREELAKSATAQQNSEKALSEQVSLMQVSVKLMERQADIMERSIQVAVRQMELMTVAEFTNSKQVEMLRRTAQINIFQGLLLAQSIKAEIKKGPPPPGANSLLIKIGAFEKELEKELEVGRR